MILLLIKLLKDGIEQVVKFADDMPLDDIRHQLQKKFTKPEVAQGINKRRLAKAGALGVLATEDEVEASFIGKMAKTWSGKALELAESMTKAGKNRDEIWKATGDMGHPTYKDVDGHWKQEIDDSKFKPRDLFKTRKDARAQLDEYDEVSASLEKTVTHPELRRSYPDEFKYTEAITIPYSRVGSYGDQLITSGSSYRYGDKALKTDPSIVSHEMQHMVQETEGFAKGGNPESFTSDYSRAIHNIDYYESQKTDKILDLRKTPEYIENEKALNKALDANDMKAVRPLVHKRSKLERDATANVSAEIIELQNKTKFKPFEQYQRLAGEAEARNVQTRLDFPMSERKAKPPWSTLDVPEKELIVKGATGLSALGGSTSFADNMQDMKYKIPSAESLTLPEGYRPESQAIPIPEDREGMHTLGMWLKQNLDHPLGGTWLEGLGDYLTDFSEGQKKDAIDTYLSGLFATLDVLP